MHAWGSPHNVLTAKQCTDSAVNTLSANPLFGGGRDHFFGSCDCDAVLTPVAVLASPAAALVASTGSTIVVEPDQSLAEGQLYALSCLEGLKGKDFEGHFPPSDTRSGR